MIFFGKKKLNIFIKLVLMLALPLQIALASTLYSVKVPALDLSTNHVFKQALSNALVNLSGDADIVKQGEISDVLNHANRFVVSYSSENGFMNVQFDVAVIKQLIKTARNTLTSSFTIEFAGIKDVDGYLSIANKLRKLPSVDKLLLNSIGPTAVQFTVMTDSNLIDLKNNLQNIDNFLCITPVNATDLICYFSQNTQP
ncbi:MAG: DUF2066 domain-containing protein [Gammaproteobacteria bacterium]|nr:DUF2066 domain-containing protein [Gammaproteobacteria bacterium]